MTSSGSRKPESAFEKRRADAPEGFFAWEAAGLDWLREPGGVEVVGVREVGSRHIVLDRITLARATTSAAEAFGRGLAVTHAAGATAFGAGPPGWRGVGYIGRQELALGAFPTWGVFYAETRLLPYARAAVGVGNLSQAALSAVEAVCSRLIDGAYDDDRPPARIHGDLWGGNVLYSARGAVVIDPAAHGGHGLTDVAMLALFGTEQLDRVLAAYAEAASLPAGWRELIGLHQLHPVLVHAASHGPSYGRHAAELAARYR
ncbi:fructosamine kinase family protein [Nakamurella sp. GG22]